MRAIFATCEESFSFGREEIESSFNDEKTQSESSVKAIEATCNESFSSISVGRERVESIFDDEKTQSDSSVNVIEASSESSTSDDSGREEGVSEAVSKFGIIVSNVLLTSTSS